ncbi:MAG: bifunctional DNA-formamidopyrimidine glycosylase/DNA-(apurinic or apyrimidinic site) lyase [Xanthomonadales bacterium]|nr:bifunctional DNA-formamidopyrimidine glycosylase/DNA-(apurinic or apyrimidinic site) lyase [Xanthomonadales bacterium]
MPELPEVETTRRGIEPLIMGRRVEAVVVRQPMLRWPIPEDLSKALPGQRIRACRRRAKYLLLEADKGTLIAHLGMSGSFAMAPAGRPPGKHDHVDLCFEDGTILRFRDPRRFGALLWTTEPTESHPLLKKLGVEPLGEDFNGALLHAAARTRTGPVKLMIMNASVVVGVGNIYACESLFRAGIHPRRPARRVGARRYERLADEIRKVLGEAIAQGGTTLRDFVDSSGQPGYFAQDLAVYGRAGDPCPRCGEPVRREVISQRSTFYCIACQT